MIFCVHLKLINKYMCSSSSTWEGGYLIYSQIFFKHFVRIVRLFLLFE